MQTNDSTADDAALVARVRAGDPTAFAAIHARLGGELLAYARAHLGARREEAEDVVQDAFIRAYRALLADDRPVVLRPWMYAIVRNRVIDELRRAPRLLVAEPKAVGPVAEDPSAAVAWHEELDAVLADVAALPERQRHALVRQAVDGEPHERIAARLGTSVGATKNLVNRARTTLVASRAQRGVCVAC
jgi:RNA polymerase sigma-70 factor (ECF subfamily)